MFIPFLHQVRILSHNTGGQTRDILQNGNDIAFQEEIAHEA
jgi:hypothetical protein